MKIKSLNSDLINRVEQLELKHDDFYVHQIGYKRCHLSHGHTKRGDDECIPTYIEIETPLRSENGNIQGFNMCMHANIKKDTKLCFDGFL